MKIPKKIFEIDIKPKEDLFDKQADVVSKFFNIKEYNVYYHIYNTEHKKFVENFIEIKSNFYI